MSKTKQATANIISEHELVQWLDKSSSMLLLFDIHLNWSGPCETMLPQLDALYRSIDQSEKRFKILSIEVPKLSSKFEEKVQISPSCTYSLSLNDDSNIDSNEKNPNHDYHAGCCSVKTLLNESCCSPLFMAVKNQKVFAVVRGANFPALSKIIYDNIPKVEDDVDPNEAS